MKSKRRKWIIGMAIGVLAIVLSPFLGMSGTIKGMNQAFASMTNNDLAKPEELSHAIQAVLEANLIGFIGVGCGVVILLIFLVGFLLSEPKAAVGAPPQLPS